MRWEIIHSSLVQRLRQWETNHIIGGLFYFGIFFFFFLIEDRTYTAAERFGSDKAGVDTFATGSQLGLAAF